MFVRSSWLLIAALVCSQMSWPQTQPSSQPPSTNNGQTLTFKAGAQEVNLDIVVRDAKGHLIKTLKPGDVQVFEDGIKQNLIDFRYVPGKPSIQNPEPTAKADVPAAHTINEVNVVALVFHGLDPNTKKNARDFARQFIQNNLPPNTWLGMFNLTDNLIPLHEFTNDKAQMVKAVDESPTGMTDNFLSLASRILNAAPNVATVTTSINGSGPSTSATSSMDITGGEVNLKAINGADVSTGQGANRMRGDEAGARLQFTGIDAHRNFDSLNLLIDQFAKLPGHKSILFLSTGIVGLDDPDRMENMIKRAAKAGITFYSVDVNGLQQNSNALAADTAVNYARNLRSANIREQMRQDDYINQGVRQSNSQATLRQIAEDTGGFLIANTNDLRKPFEHIIEDLDSHYEAVYSPTDTKMDGRLRSIEVKVDHPGWTVESRTGYYAMPALSADAALTQADLVGLAALNVKPAPHSFNFDFAALQFRPVMNGIQQAITFELPVSHLAVTPLDNGQKFRVHASVLALVKNASGDVVDKFSQDSPFEFPASSLKQAAFSTLDFAHPINLPAGHYTADISVFDHEAGKASVSRFAFFNPVPSPIELSSIVLVQRIEPIPSADPSDPFQISVGGQAKRVIPEMENNIAKNAKPTVYFVVYPNKDSAEKPKLQVELLVNDKVVDRQLSDLAQAGPDGSVPMVLTIPATPGSCELRVSAIQGAQAVTHSLYYNVNP